MFGNLDLPINASRGFISISRASCFSYLAYKTHQGYFGRQIRVSQLSLNILRGFGTMCYEWMPFLTPTSKNTPWVFTARRYA